MSRYQRLAALVEISSTVSRMTGKAPDDIYSRLVGVPQSKLSNAVNSLLREAKRVAAWGNSSCLNLIAYLLKKLGGEAMFGDRLMSTSRSVVKELVQAVMDAEGDQLDEVHKFAGPGIKGLTFYSKVRVNKPGHEQHGKTGNVTWATGSKSDPDFVVKIGDKEHTFKRKDLLHQGD
jgi:hypothetical protein